jgi:hypothetical protein
MRDQFPVADCQLGAGALSIISLDTNEAIVEQSEFKKIYRAKHAKLAKASPFPVFC